MFYKVESVEPLPSYVLRVVFINGEIKYYRVSSLFDKWEVFNELREIPGLFDQVKVDSGGYGVSWNDRIDLECNDLWEFGEKTLTV